MATNHLETLTSNQLAALVGSFKSGALRHDLSALSLKATVPSLTDKQIEGVIELTNDGWRATQILVLLTTLQKTHESHDPFSHLLDLVISGPSMTQAPTRSTKAVFHELVAGVESEILVVSFAIYNGMTLLKPLAEKLESNPNISAKFILNIPRGRNDITLSEQLIAKFKDEFLNNTWPGSVLPTLLHFPRSLEQNWRDKASLHSKVIVVDRKRLFISSANLTDAAQDKNIETGVIIEHAASALRLVNYFDSLKLDGLLKPF